MAIQTKEPPRLDHWERHLPDDQTLAKMAFAISELQFQSQVISVGALDPDDASTFLHAITDLRRIYELLLDRVRFEREHLERLARS